MNYGDDDDYSEDEEMEEACEMKMEKESYAAP